LNGLRGDLLVKLLLMISNEYYNSNIQGYGLDINFNNYSGQVSIQTNACNIQLRSFGAAAAAHYAQF